MLQAQAVALAAWVSQVERVCIDGLNGNRCNGATLPPVGDGKEVSTKLEFE